MKMDQSQIVLGILTFITFSLPIVASLYRLFAVREKLQASISENRHRLELQEQQITHLLDQQTLFLKGLDERLEHVRERSRQQEEGLNHRLLDLEIFIEKTTAFTRRRE
jgi:hypothetical protein